MAQDMNALASLIVDGDLFTFVEERLLGDGGPESESFWPGFAALVAEMAPRNAALLATRELALAISGASKLAVFQQARLGADEALPVSLVLNQHQTPVSVWMA